MRSFKSFITDKIAYLVANFRRKAILLGYDGSPLSQIDLSFDALSDEYLQLQQQSGPSSGQATTSIAASQNSANLRITDHDLLPFIQNLDEQWTGKFSIADQNITDQTILRLADLLLKEKCRFTALDFSNNRLMTFIGGVALADALRNNGTVRVLTLKGITLEKEGANRLIELVSTNKIIRDYDFGKIGNDSLLYLAKHMENPHVIENLAFGQNSNKKWQVDGKKSFDHSLRKNPCNKQINSITLYPEHPEDHYVFLAELSIICSKNRQQRIKQRENDFKSKSLNPEHPKYYDPDNHTLNAYKFSVKSYLTNVFGSMLDEGLYFLEKERRNSLREQAIFNITKLPTNKAILQDICTSDGSIMVLTQYLLKKIKGSN